MKAKKERVNVYTYTTRFGDFHHCHPTAVYALHLNIQFLVAYDEDHVDCDKPNEQLVLKCFWNFKKKKNPRELTAKGVHTSSNQRLAMVRC
jgi:hypothetical protein